MNICEVVEVSFRRICFYTFHIKIFCDLRWYFFKKLLCQIYGIIFNIIECDELYAVSLLVAETFMS